jgi:hypothetical protein
MLRIRPRIVRFVGPLLAALAIWGLAGASSKYVLIIRPSMTHLGDIAYLSGGGFPPNAPLTIVMTCSDTSDSTKNRITVGAAGPTTDARGQLVGVPFQPPSLPDGLHLNCQFFPSFAGQGNGTIVPAIQYVVPSTSSLWSNGDPLIGYGLTNSHGSWLVHLSSWPGATLKGRIRYFPSLRLQRFSRTLGWQGQASFAVPKGAFDGKGVKAVWVLANSTFVGRQSTMDMCFRVHPLGPGMHQGHSNICG